MPQAADSYIKALNSTAKVAALLFGLADARENLKTTFKKSGQKGFSKTRGFGTAGV